MTKALYEVRDPVIEPLLRDIAGRIGGALPDGWGFLLMLYEFGTAERPGNSFYISNAERADAIKMLKEWIAKQEGEVNPEHKVTAEMREHPERWMQFCAALLAHVARTSGSSPDAWVDLVDEDVQLLQSLPGVTVAVSDDKVTGLRLRLMDGETARKLAEQERKEGR